MPSESMVTLPGSLEVAQELDQHVRKEDPSTGAHERKNRALREELAHQTASAGTDGQAHPDLSLSSRCPGKQQVGQVGAGQEQRESGDPHEEPDESAHLGLTPVWEQITRERVHRDGAWPASVRVLLGELIRHGQELRPRLLHGTLWVETSEEHVHPTAAASLPDGLLGYGPDTKQCTALQWNPDLRFRIEPHTLEAWTGDSHDLEGRTVEPNRLSDDFRVGEEVILPVVVAEDGHRCTGPEDIILGLKQPTGRGRNAQKLEVVASYRLQGDEDGSTAVVAQARGQKAGRGHIGEVGRTVPVIQIVRIRR